MIRKISESNIHCQKFWHLQIAYKIVKKKKRKKEMWKIFVEYIDCFQGLKIRLN